MKTKLIQHLEVSIEYAQESMNEFAARFAKDPAYALERSGDSFQAAAKLDIHTRLLNWGREEKTTFEEMIAAIKDEVLRGALYPHNSTSPASNLMATCKLQVWAELAQKYAGAK